MVYSQFVQLHRHLKLYVSAFLVLLLSAASICAQSNYINSANAALKTGDLVRASELLEQAEEHCGESDKVKQNTAILMALQGDTDAAIKELDGMIKKDSDNPSLRYNRAILYLEQGDYLTAIDDFKEASALGAKAKSKSERNAYSLKRQSEEKQVVALAKLAEQASAKESFEQAHEYYEKALVLRPNETQLRFAQANLGLLEQNPFTTLEAIDKIKHVGTTDAQQLEITLLKAYSLGRINKMHDAIRLLENALYSYASEDVRVRELLSYYYLKLSKYQKTLDVLSGRSFSNSNTFVIAGNAALRLKKYKHALFCFKEARALDRENVNAALGIALCYSSTNRNSESIPFIDSLATVHPENHNVWNVKGIIHKDVGLHYKNNFRDNQAKTFFVTSAAAFHTAQELNTHMKSVYESNRALSLFFQNQKEAAKMIWTTNVELSSQNNLALLYASQKNYKAAYNLLDDLYDDFWIKHKKKHNIIDYNRGLARSRESLNNNYKFLTNFKLNQKRPTLEVENVFNLGSVKDVDSPESFDYILAHSNEDCKEQQAKRKKSKKKKKFRLFKRKKKKYKGGCPTF